MTQLGIWVCLATFVEFAGSLLTRLDRNNVTLYNSYWVVEFVLLVVITRTTAVKRSAWTALIIPAFVLLWVAEFVSVWGQNEFVIYSVMIGAFVLVGLYLALLWDLVNTWTGRLYRSPTFWLCLTVLLYFGGAAPVLGSVNYFNGTDTHVAQQLYWVVRGLCVLKFLLMARMFSCMSSSTYPVLHGRPV